jgi:hypothetical protein
MLNVITIRLQLYLQLTLQLIDRNLIKLLLNK